MNIYTIEYEYKNAHGEWHFDSFNLYDDTKEKAKATATDKLREKYGPGKYNIVNIINQA